MSKKVVKRKDKNYFCLKQGRGLKTSVHVAQPLPRPYPNNCHSGWYCWTVDTWMINTFICSFFVLLSGQKNVAKENRQTSCPLLVMYKVFWTIQKQVCDSWIQLQPVQATKHFQKNKLGHWMHDLTEHTARLYQQDS